MKSTEKVFLAGLIILFITNAVTCSNMNKLRDALGQMRSETSGLNITMSNIESNISNTMQDIKRDNQWIYDQGFEITSLSSDLKNAAVALKWSFRRLNKNSQVFISYGEKDTATGSVAKWTELPAASSGVLSYVTEITLPVKGNYKFRVIARNSTGTESSELADVDLLNYMQNRMQINITPLTRDSNGVRYSLSIRNQYKYFLAGASKNVTNIDTGKLKIKNIKVDIYFDNQLSSNFYVYEDGKAVSGYEINSPGRLEEIEFINLNNYIKLQNDMNKHVHYEVTVEDYYGNVFKQSSHDM